MCVAPMEDSHLVHFTAPIMTACYHLFSIFFVPPRQVVLRTITDYLAWIFVRSWNQRIFCHGATQQQVTVVCDRKHKSTKQTPFSLVALCQSETLHVYNGSDEPKPTRKR
jgi:hypothetical protein